MSLEGAGTRHDRRWSNLLLNRRFQLKYTGMIVGLSMVISLGLGTFLARQIHENTRMLQLESELDPLMEQVAARDLEVIGAMVASLVAFNLLLAIGGLVVTHRLAGPIFVFRRHLEALRDGRLPVMRALRRGDEFSELLQTLEQAVSAVEARARRDADLLARARAALEAGRDDALGTELEARARELQGMLER